MRSGSPVDNGTTTPAASAAKAAVRGSSWRVPLRELGRCRRTSPCRSVERLPLRRVPGRQPVARNRSVQRTKIGERVTLEGAARSSFGGRLRDECLNVPWFVAHAGRETEARRQDYNEGGRIRASATWLRVGRAADSGGRALKTRQTEPRNRSPRRRPTANSRRRRSGTSL